MSADLLFIDRAINELTIGRDYLLKTLAPPIAPETLPVLVPVPAATYELPRETDSQLTKFYGPASKNMDLGWFSFPTDKIRLYNRNGVELKSAVGDFRDDHRCHKKLTDRLTNALAEIYILLGEEEFAKQGWHVYGGCHNYRPKTGGSSLSTHAWAVAVDVNPDENYYAKTTTTFSSSAIDVMEKWGFLSGGRAWGKDWMHFQAVIPNISTNSYYAQNGFPKNIVVA